jgi:hypothetical protein
MYAFIREMRLFPEEYSVPLRLEPRAHQHRGFFYLKIKY